MGVLGKGVRLQVTGFRKSKSLQEFCLDARHRRAGCLKKAFALGLGND